MSNGVAQLNANCSEADQRESLQQLLRYSVRELAALLATETKKFMARRPYDGRIGLALFTLAITHNNQEAWNCLYEQYKPLVVSWIMRSPQTAKIIACDGDTTPLVNGVFAKFFQAMSLAKLEHFDSLGALLKYLQCCAYSVVADQARSQRTYRGYESLDEIEEEPAIDDPAGNVLATMQAQQLWQLIEEIIPSEEERQLLRLTYVQGMRPVEICERVPTAFPTVEDVYRVKRNVLERLRRNQELRRAFDAFC